jgi:DNA end-binding protein Ku
MRGKRYIGALRAHEGYLLLMKLRYSEEVLSAAQLPAPGGRALDAREVNMAEQLVKALEGEFSAGDFHDEYRERVLAFIEQKANGLKPKLAVVKERKPAASLVDALAASLESAKKEKRVA